MKKRFFMNRKMGFTLIEMMIILGILSALAAIAIPSINAWMPSYRLKSASRELYSNLQLAKLEAIKRNTDCTVTVNTGAGTYNIDLLDRTIPLGDENGIVFTNEADTTTTITFSPRGTATFDPVPADNVGKLFITNSKMSSIQRIEISSVGNLRLSN